MLTTGYVRVLTYPKRAHTSGEISIGFAKYVDGFANVSNLSRYELRTRSNIHDIAQSVIEVVGLIMAIAVVVVPSSVLTVGFLSLLLIFS